MSMWYTMFDIITCPDMIDDNKNTTTTTTTTTNNNNDNNNNHNINNINHDMVYNNDVM